MHGQVGMPAEELIRRSYEALELPYGAGLRDVSLAYERLRGLYGSEAMALWAASDDLTPERRAQILKELDDARSALVELHGNKPMDAAPANSTTEVDYSGAGLRARRIALGLSAKEMEVRIKVRALYVERIEEGRLAELPPEVFVRGYLKLMARALGLDEALTLKGYYKS